MVAALIAAGIVARRPALWAVALAGFLARGGILPLLVPFIVLPDIVGLTTFVGANAITAAGPSPGFLVFVGAVVVALVGWLLLGTVAGCLVDVQLVRASAPRPDDATAAPDHLVASLLAIRLLALLPLVAALGWGVFRLVDVGYRELILPGNLAVPFPIRVLGDAPEVSIVIAVALLAGELLGAVATRMTILDRRPAVASLAAAARWLVLHWRSALGTTIATAAGTLLLLVPTLVAVALLWQAVVATLLGDGPPVAAALAVFGFSAAWLASLALAGAASAWRSVAWSCAIRRS